MLSHDEQRAWDEIRCHFAEDAEEPAPPVLDRTVRPPRDSRPVGLSAAVVAGGCLAALLIILGAPVVGLAIAVAVLPRWLLWRYWSSLEGVVGPSAPTAIRDVPLDGEGHSSPGEHRRDTPRTA
ncbi:DUF3040 domain-containing protein [Modestobacter marinus]|uniref:DUF3040 domain-containing protein n=1 Tax=Modestobacter marinus TaxID=477641 RepID=UPI001C937260|nr:DUF3040 domain-containing protein [Modestobacter marinus]